MELDLDLDGDLNLVLFLVVVLDPNLKLEATVITTALCPLR